MIVCRFTLPKRHIHFEATIAHRFGGFTRWEAVGGWSGPDGLEIEPMAVYEVAVHQPEVQNLKLLVYLEAKTQGEKALYFVTGINAEVIEL